MNRLLDIWHSAARVDMRFTILPDGCRDVIVSQRADAPPRYDLSPLATRPVGAAAQAHERKTGYRLAPGMRLDLRALECALGGAHPEQDCSAQIEEACRPDPSVAEAIACLAGDTPSVEQACKRLGVSERSLQKLFARRALPAPVFWHQLARARRAAVQVCAGGALAEIAAQEGFADQAHMSRSFKRFFGIAPSKLAGSDLSAQVLHPALATGEQISTRIPSGSLT